MNTPFHNSIDRPMRVSKIHRPAKRRRMVQCDLAVIPVRLDQTPGEVFWSDGFSVNQAGTNVRLVIECAQPLPVKQLIIGASFSGGPRQFIVLNIAAQKMNPGHKDPGQQDPGQQDPLQMDQGRLRISGRIIKNPLEDMLSERNLSPHIDAAQLRFCYGAKQEVLRKWETLGVMRRFFVDKVLVCPKCHTLPTWRNACPKCGSARFSTDRLIHHFACAHVDRAATFQDKGGSVQCPKCQENRLTAGTDFEYIDGPVNCFDCQASGGQPVLSCMCHRCLVRFDPQESTQLDIHGYHVDRLDLLDLVASSQ